MRPVTKQAKKPRLLGGISIEVGKQGNPPTDVFILNRSELRGLRQTIPRSCPAHGKLRAWITDSTGRKAIVLGYNIKCRESGLTPHLSSPDWAHGQKILADAICVVGLDVRGVHHREHYREL